MSPLGSASLVFTLVAARLPLFLTVMANVTLSPGAKKPEGGALATTTVLVERSSALTTLIVAARSSTWLAFSTDEIVAVLVIVPACWFVATSTSKKMFTVAPEATVTPLDDNVPLAQVTPAGAPTRRQFTVPLGSASVNVAVAAFEPELTSRRS